jgi:hypothetical protein
MSQSVQEQSLSVDSDPILDDLVAELTDLVQGGRGDEAVALVGRHPEYAERLRRLIPAIEAMADRGETGRLPLGPRESPAGKAGTTGVPSFLGDFRLIREVGRGGMGIVYEAEQRSLRRRVALKVLPLAAAFDARQKERFRLEARAAACLHHTHIVPVHAVGVDRGVPYYAMEFIDGCSLAGVLNQLRGRRARSVEK